MLCQAVPELRSEWVKQFLQWMRSEGGGLYPEGLLRLGRSFISYRQRSPLFLISYTRCAYYSLRLDSRYLFSLYPYSTFSRLSRLRQSTTGTKFSLTCCENCLILSAFILLSSYFYSRSPCAIFTWVGLLQETRYSSPALFILRSRSRMDSFSLRTSMKVFSWSEISAREMGRCRLRISANFFLRYSRMEACFCVKDYSSFSWRDLCMTTRRYYYSCFFVDDSRSSIRFLIFCMFSQIFCIFSAFLAYSYFKPVFFRSSSFCYFITLAASRFLFSQFWYSRTFFLSSSRFLGGLRGGGDDGRSLDAAFPVLKSQSLMDWIDLLRYSSFLSSCFFSRSASAIFLAFINLSYCSDAVSLDLLSYRVTSISPLAILVAQDSLRCFREGLVRWPAGLGGTGYSLIIKNNHY